MAFVSAAAIRPTSFIGARVCSVAPSAATVTMAARSASVPFLPQPAACDGSMAGDVGFDPLNLSGFIDIKWLREGELKNGRVAMLAFLGVLVQEFVHLPSPLFANPVATDAFFQVPAGGLWQIFLACGVAEFVGHRGKLSYGDMFEDGRIPGNFGFDPLGLYKGTPAQKKKLELAEVKNGRLAMIGIGGVIHSNFIYHQPIVSQLTHFVPITQALK
eukprot:TRINITY_DN286_c0_g1_i3.p2 TRINITY_DN286_c0_g1~~TRINITY_DN286_c0_g1_i3.p2  ORF type:complete len:216 (-),score=66.55 TRINITY_DN286_c0_g1_i3:225-872(-)